jgi:hypothetical protein
MFIRVIQGRATNPPGIRRDLGRWQHLARVARRSAQESGGEADEPVLEQPRGLMLSSSDVPSYYRY